MLSVASTRSAAVSVLLIGAILLADASLLAQDSSNQFLQEAKILYDNGQYSEAMQKLQQAIKIKGTPRKDIVEIYKYMGFIYIVQGHKENARKAFELLLKVDPGYEMNPLLTSPKFLNFFNKIRDDLRQKDRVIMRHTALTEVSAAERIEVRAYVVDLQKNLSKMVLYYRRRDDPQYSSVEMSPSKEAAVGMGQGAQTYVGFIPFLWNVYGESELFIDYYLAALDSQGRWVANSGNPKQPVTFRVNLLAGKVPEEALKPPLTRTWWFWTLIGVGVAAVVGGGVAIGLAMQKEPAPPNTGAAVLILRM